MSAHLHTTLVLKAANRYKNGAAYRAAPIDSLKSSLPV